MRVFPFSQRLRVLSGSTPNRYADTRTCTRICANLVLRGAVYATRQQTNGSQSKDARTPTHRSAEALVEEYILCTLQIEECLYTVIDKRIPSPCKVKSTIYQVNVSIGLPKPKREIVYHLDLHN